jgi:hypothetical protein
LKCVCFFSTTYNNLPDKAPKPPKILKLINLEGKKSSSAFTKNTYREILGIGETTSMEILDQPTCSLGQSQNNVQLVHVDEDSQSSVSGHVFGLTLGEDDFSTSATKGKGTEI